ncbi:uncharacterized protein FOMMEDRAFT_31512 [Fomitiporia mediterranea MF3/22]|uniref:uncharacterized protein n=1 Tax=Fomitiporia mediterranea (strain MF3/22) TaxID=694068 RepID=UPI0004408EB9|nr:uncharacterized protein FOMMEDRAFT_31512 [Fomitiporia mediterranea MF3/22]EJC98945.1 hypothetical protein FOMMEDRAFT_31512 [Fomitiporia mediterranea MF3/22]
MDLYFSRRRFFQTSFHAPASKTESGERGRLKEVYRVSTTVRKNSIFPDVTTIEFVGAEDEEKHYVVATIEWKWPSQASSVIEIDDKRMTLKEFMKREDGLFSTGTHVMVDEDRYTWRSSVCRPAALYDTQGRTAAIFSPRSFGLRPVSRICTVQPACLHLLSGLATDAYARDITVASFFVYRACRDLQIILTPWWREKQADFTGIELQA